MSDSITSDESIGLRPASLIVARPVASPGRWKSSRGAMRGCCSTAAGNQASRPSWRYLISRIDARRMARIRKSAPLVEPPPDASGQAGASPAPPVSPPTKQRKWLSIYNEELWTRLD